MPDTPTHVNLSNQESSTFLNYQENKRKTAY